MRQQPTDNSPRMASTSSGRYRSEFESVLPPGARDELLRAPHRRHVAKQQPALPAPPPSPPREAHGWLNAALGYSALIGLPIAGLILLGSLSNSWRPSSTLVTKSATSAPEATPMPQAPQPAPTPLVRRAEPVAPVVPRAMLVRLPSPREELSQPLTDLSPAHFDESHDITMPYGMVVRATLRGFLEQENQLPRVGRIGDMYVVGSVPWIWIQVPGTTAPTWVDP